MPEKHQKLSDGDVSAIRQRLEVGESPKALAIEYGVSRPLISMIKNGRKRSRAHRVSLRSGGEIIFTSSVDIFSLSESDQQFLNKLLRCIHEYEVESE